MLEQVRVVLSRTSHPGNIGASARAMKNMGLEELYLVAPKKFPDAEASARAKHAESILDGAVVVENLDAALNGCTLVLGTSARDSSLALPVVSPSAAIQLIRDTHKTAIVFGAERTGLTKQELQHCNYLINIPTAGNYVSLNLSQAVQIICYELCNNFTNYSMVSQNIDNLATADKMADFFNELEQILIKIKMLNPAVPRTLMQRMRALFNRASITEIELNMLRGMLTAIDREVRK